MTPDIPPMPTHWFGTWEEWVEYRQAGNDSVREYFQSIADVPLQTDEHGAIVFDVSLDHGVAKQTRPTLAQQLFSKR
jgi:hypothetical protein